MFETVTLDQFDNPAKARLDTGRQGFQLGPNAGVEQLHKHFFRKHGPGATYGQK